MRIGDNIKQDAPHCHAPIHPPAPTPTPVPHPGLPLAMIKGEATVLIGKMPASRTTDTSAPCMLPGCVPGGPGMITKGSATVLVAKMPQARLNDLTAHASCVAPIPAPVGKCMGPGCSTVLVGG
jgi:uncharacterized Zn-binding protein involved in type VI secretion